MKLILHQSKSIKSNNSTFPRWVYDCDTHILKIIPNGTSALFTAEQLNKNANVINETLGFKYFYGIETVDNFIHMNIHKLDNANYNHTIKEDFLEMLDIWIDINLKIFPLCNVDINENNIRLYKDKPVLIDWDDALQGNKHTAFYIIAELYRHCMVFLDQQEVVDCIQHRIQSTCLEIDIKQWDWIINNYQLRGYDFEKVLHWSELPDSWLLKKD